MLGSVEDFAQKVQSVSRTVISRILCRLGIHREASSWGRGWICKGIYCRYYRHDPDNVGVTALDEPRCPGLGPVGSEWVEIDDWRVREFGYEDYARHDRPDPD